MKKLILCTALCLGVVLSGYGQTTLSPGDIAFVRYNTDADDGFSFVALTSIASGDSIFFTDEGWDDTAGTTGWRVSGEEHIKYISAGLSAGDVVHIEETTLDNFTVTGGGTATLRRGSGFSLSDGDQIIAYVGSEVRPSSPTFIAGLHGDDGAGTTTGSNDPSTKWTRDGEVSGTQPSTLPDRLINGVSAISVFGDAVAEVDNMIYNCATTSGTKAELLIAINNRANWTTDDTNNQPSSSVCSFTVSSNPSIAISGDAGWRLLSLPITGGTVEAISDDSPVQGVTGGTDAGSAANFIIYDSDATFEQPASVTTPWGDGLGFGLYFYNNTTNGSSTLPIALDATGSEPSSDVTVTLNPAASGYTLVGNPFASNFNTNLMTATSSNISNNIAFWNDGTSSYSTQNRTTPYIVSPWQGFWVQTVSAAATTLTFPTAGKTSNSTTGTFFSKQLASRGDIKFTLVSGSTYDEAIRLSFTEQATSDYDADDFGKLTPLVPSYATMAFRSNNMLKSVESLPWNLEQEVTVDLEAQIVGVNGEFTFAWSGLETIPSEWELILHDYEKGTSTNLREVENYTFEMAAHQKAVANSLSILRGPAASPMRAKAGESRFALTIRPVTTVNNELLDEPRAFILHQNYPNPFNPSTVISYQLAQSSEVLLTVYNALGQQMGTLVDTQQAAGAYNIRWNANGMAGGIYYYRLQANGLSTTRSMTLIK